MSLADTWKQHVQVCPDSEPSRQAYVQLLKGKTADELRWWSKDTVALVTGGNKGIGLETVRQLATAGITTILSARDESRGLEAVTALKAEGLENVIFHQLEVTSPDSAASLATWIKEKFGGLDILVNNAGVGRVDATSFRKAKIIIDTNYIGQRIVTSMMLPLMRPSPAGARIIMVSSEIGQLQYLLSEGLKQQLNDLDRLTVADVDSLAAKYLQDAKENHLWTAGFAPEYKVSKALLNAYGRLLAKSLSGRPDGEKVYVNLTTPGLTTTDLNGNFPGARTVKEGADTVIWLALFPRGGPNGRFLRDRADFPF